jgi:hypothetical protein
MAQTSTNNNAAQLKAAGLDGMSQVKRKSLTESHDYVY